jgi:hypothetical protein
LEIILLAQLAESKRGTTKGTTINFDQILISQGYKELIPYEITSPMVFNQFLPTSFIRIITCACPLTLPAAAADDYIF